MLVIILFEGIMLVENEPPAAKAGYGPGKRMPSCKTC